MRYLDAYILPESRESLRQVVEDAFDIRLAYGDSSYYLDLYLYWPRLRKGWRDWFRRPEKSPFVSIKITPNGAEDDAEPFSQCYSLDHWLIHFQLDGLRDHEVYEFLAATNAEIEV